MSTVPCDAPLYGVIHRRRDVRVGFTGAPLEPGVLNRMLEAAHAAPSVGLTQPWDFVIVDDDGIRAAFHDHVIAEGDLFAESLPDGRDTREQRRVKVG